MQSLLELARSSEPRSLIHGLISIQIVQLDITKAEVVADELLMGNFLGRGKLAQVVKDPVLILTCFVSGVKDLIELWTAR